MLIHRLAGFEDVILLGTFFLLDSIRVEWNILHIEPTSSGLKERQNVVKSILFSSSKMALKSAYLHKNARCGGVLTVCGFALHNFYVVIADTRFDCSMLNQ